MSLFMTLYEAVCCCDSDIISYNAAAIETSFQNSFVRLFCVDYITRIYLDLFVKVNKVYSINCFDHGMYHRICACQQFRRLSQVGSNLEHISCEVKNTQQDVSELGRGTVFIGLQRDLRDQCWQSLKLTPHVTFVV